MILSSQSTKSYKISTYRYPNQNRKTKGIPKLYSWHNPEIEVIAKCNAITPYEFGVKVGITSSTLKSNLILGARSFPIKTYDGRTLAEQASILSNRPSQTNTPIFAIDVLINITQVQASGSASNKKQLNIEERKLLKCHQASETLI